MIKYFVFATFLFSISAQAVTSPKYPGKNLALTCGDYDIVTSGYTTSEVGHLVGGDMDLGPTVQAVKGHQTIEMVKTEDADAGLMGFGAKKGFGLFDGGILKLDLRNTVDKKEIYLENPYTGEKVLCQVHGDCC